MPPTNGVPSIANEKSFSDFYSIKKKRCFFDTMEDMFGIASVFGKVLTKVQNQKLDFLGSLKSVFSDFKHFFEKYSKKLKNYFFKQD